MRYGQRTSQIITVKIMKKTTTKTKTTENTTLVNETQLAIVTNASKTNKSINDINFIDLFDKLNKCTCKSDLVDVVNEYGIYASTKKSTNQCLTDLYIQLFDKSRILLSKKTIKLYTCNDVASEFKQFMFKPCNDGSYRKVYATVDKTVENLKLIFEFFAKNSQFWLPTENVVVTK